MGLKGRKVVRKNYLGFACTLVVLGVSTQVKACTTVLVGKDATIDGTTIIARNEDADTAWAKHFYVHQASENNSTQYVSNANGFTLSLPQKALRYTSTPDWEQKNGQNQFGEGGINSANVAMSATESGTTNITAMKADPFIKDGVSEESVLDVVLPYIYSAKEGIEYLGKIVETKGSAGCNGIIFSDKDSIWYMEIGSGHTWAAVRVPNNKYAVIANQMMIGNVNTADNDNYLTSKNLSDMVKKYKLNGYRDRTTINYAAAFGTNSQQDASYNRPRVWDGQRILTPSKKQSITKTKFPMFLKPDDKISLKKVEQVLASHFNDTKYDSNGKWKGGYRPINVPTDVESHILQIRNGVPNEVAGIQWLAMASPATSVYVPFFTDAKDTPTQYQQGANIPDNKSAYWTYKMTRILTDPYKNRLIDKDVLPVQKKVNKQLVDNLAKATTESKKISRESLPEYLTQQNRKNANIAQNAFDKLNKQLIIDSSKQSKITINKDL